MFEEEAADGVPGDEGGDHVFLEANLELLDEVLHDCPVVILSSDLVLFALGVLLPAAGA